MLAQEVREGSMDKVLINCDNRFLKGMLLRVLVDAGLDVAEASDEEDVRLKLSLFGDAIVLYILEVTRQNRERLYEEVFRLTAQRNPYRGAILALVPDESSDMVGGALRAGIGDVILLPQRHERYRDVLMERLPAVVDKGRALMNRVAADAAPVAEIPEVPVTPVVQEDLGAELIRELKMANRGGHTLSLLMVRTVGLTDEELGSFTDTLVRELRDTDRVLPHGPLTFIVVCQFTAKGFIVEVERKVRDVYNQLFGPSARDRRIFLFGANYPAEEQDAATLLTRMENGIHDSMAFTSLRESLHTLSASEIEKFRRKLKLYKL